MLSLLTPRGVKPWAIKANAYVMLTLITQHPDCPWQFIVAMEDPPRPFNAAFCRPAPGQLMIGISLSRGISSAYFAPST